MERSRARKRRRPASAWVLLLSDGRTGARLMSTGLYSGRGLRHVPVVNCDSASETGTGVLLDGRTDSQEADRTASSVNGDGHGFGPWPSVVWWCGL